MKKILLSISIFLLAFMLVGCDKIENEEYIAGGWTIQKSDVKAYIDTEAEEAFAKAEKAYKKMDLEAIALLGTQVVAGKNYMFLARNITKGSNPELKVVTVYKDLQSSSKITNVTDFDISKYAGVDISINNEQLAGGWLVNGSDPKVVLPEEVGKTFDDAVSTFVGKGYKPITLLGTQVVAGTNYAILCLGTTTTEETINTINVLTIYKDLSGLSEIRNIASVDLKDFN